MQHEKESDGALFVEPEAGSSSSSLLSVALTQQVHTPIASRRLARVNTCPARTQNETQNPRSPLWNLPGMPVSKVTVVMTPGPSEPRGLFLPSL